MAWMDSDVYWKSRYSSRKKEKSKTVEKCRMVRKGDNGRVFFTKKRKVIAVATSFQIVWYGTIRYLKKNSKFSFFSKKKISEENITVTYGT